MVADGWWTKLDTDGHRIESQRTPQRDDGASARLAADYDSPPSESSALKLLREFHEVPVTPALELLLKSRRVKTEQEVEDDFNERQKMREQGMAPSAPRKTKPGAPTTAGSVDAEALADLGFGAREKAQCLLLPSHIETLREVYERLDKYKDKILKRSDFLMALRTDERVVDFIDVDAVKVASAKAKVLTLDQVLVEVERDESYEQSQMAGRERAEAAINHKEFITWREFLTYLEDYREIEERNKKAQGMEQTRRQLH